MRIHVRFVKLLARRPEALAALAGALAIVLAATAVRGGAVRQSQRVASPPGASRRLSPARPRRPPAASGQRPGRSPSGAVDVATADLLALGSAGIGGIAEARSVVDAVAVGPLKARLEDSLPVVAGRIHARLAAGGAPAALEGWPLGWRLLGFDDWRASVAVWHLDCAASSTLRLSGTEYRTTTYDLRWAGGSWRIENLTSVSGPTPPAAGAAARQVDAFARAASVFSRYRYGS